MIQSFFELSRTWGQDGYLTGDAGRPFFSMECLTSAMGATAAEAQNGLFVRRRKVVGKHGRA